MKNFVVQLLLVCILLIILIFLFSVESHAENVPVNCTVAFNEVLPDPVGPDSGNEWLELYNCTDSAIDLNNWYIKDKSGGKQVLKGLNLPAKGFLVIYTTVSLNQTDEELYLYDPTGLKIDFFSYAASKEGLSWARSVDGTGNWLAGQPPTMGDTNYIPGNENIDPSDCFYGSKAVQISELRQMQETDTTTFFRISGVVSVDPGQISTNRIYVQDESAGILLLLPSPIALTIKTGDLVELAGKKSSYYNEPELKISSDKCIKINSEGTLQAKQIKLNLSELLANAGRLIQVTGQISKISGRTFWLETSDDIEVKVSIPQSIATIHKSKGDTSTITGILSVTTEGEAEGIFKIIPRMSSDIIIKPTVQKPSTKSSKKVLSSYTSKQSKASVKKYSPKLKTPTFKPLGRSDQKLAIKSEVISSQSEKIIQGFGQFASGSSFLTSISTILLIFRKK